MDKLAIKRQYLEDFARKQEEEAFSKLHSKENGRLKRNAYMRDWKKNNKEKVNRINKNWKDANRDLVRARERQYAKKARMLYPDRQKRSDAKYKLDHPEKIKEVQKAWRDKNKDYLYNRANNYTAYYLWENAKKRAKQYNRDFTIEISDVIVPEYCPVLGIKLQINRGIRKSGSPSLDRIDNKKGYVKGNVRVISMRANWLKRDGSLEEFEKIVTYMKREY